jgi:hypothetical protein
VNSLHAFPIYDGNQVINNKDSAPGSAESLEAASDEKVSQEVVNGGAVEVFAGAISAGLEPSEQDAMRWHLKRRDAEQEAIKKKLNKEERLYQSQHPAAHAAPDSRPSSDSPVATATSGLRQGQASFEGKRGFNTPGVEFSDVIGTRQFKGVISDTNTDGPEADRSTISTARSTTGGMSRSSISQELADGTKVAFVALQFSIIVDSRS